ncbi:MAG TPA: cysteine synthase A [Oscillospiraceae bacterium]|nr:cysteine synthase A [Oscillospiraceae bacterium]HXK77526.1 cysteine synthase A [Oscillospiraceae bacterium]
MEIKKNFTELIGNTPMFELRNIESLYGLEATVAAKLEKWNPAGSIKDRVAANMIADAEERGMLKPNSTIIEPTSGNTGIGLAAVAASKGYHVIIVMPDSMSPERMAVMKAFGAECVLTDGALGMTGCVKKAKELLASVPESFMPSQFTNPANPDAHYRTTGPEIFRQTDGKIDVLVAGIGTGGTITGTARYLKEQNPAIRIVGFQPASSPLLTKGTPGKHKIQGIGPNFIPEILDRSLIDEILDITDEDAYRFTALLAKKEGILVGISSGGAAAAAVELAKRPENRGKLIVPLFPDTGDRYFSSGVFGD